jgi:RHS repeat-associated protein
MRRAACLVLPAALAFTAPSLLAQGGSVSVTPDGGTATKPQNASGQTVTFTVTSSGAIEPQIFDLTCSATDSTSACSVQGQITVPGEGSGLVEVSFTTRGVGSGTVRLTASTANCDPEFDLGCVTDNGYYSVTVTDVGFPPIVDASPYNPSFQSYALCALSCLAATYAQSTVPYFSLDTPRNVTLVYNGDRVNPRPFVHVNVSHDPGSPYTPSEYRFEVKVNGTNVTFVNGETVLRFAYPGTAAHRLGGQFDASGYTTGVWDMEIVVTSVYAGGLVSRSVVSKLVIVNETNSAVARGWTVAGVQRLFERGDGSVLITEGDGPAAYFQNSGGVFVSPAGDFSRVTTGGLVPSGWTRTYPDSTRVYFNGGGMMIQVRDRFGNVTDVYWDGSARPWKIKDPTGREIVLAYGTNGLSSITDPFSRVTQVTVQSNRTLTAIRDPDNLATNFGYDGSLRFQSITNRRGHTTTLAYDAQSQRVSSVTAPAVAVFGEGTVAPVYTLASWQKVGVPYGATSGTAFTPPRADTVRGTLTDPGGHQTRFTANRFGQPLVSAGPLLDTVTIAYNGNGQVGSVTPRLGVSSSYGYDASGFMTSWSVGGITSTARNGGWAQADSIWSGFGVGQRIFLGQSGRVDSVRIGGRTGIHDSLQTTYRYTYDSRGRVTLARDPKQHLMAQTWYGGTNGNRSKDSLPGGRVITYGYDGYGRRTTDSVVGQPKRTTTFDVLNRPTNFYDGVNASPTVFAYEDSLNLTRVTDPAGQVYRFTYNALGWLTQERDPLSRNDLYQYSRDGELRGWTNRRGQNVDVTYDELHRRRVRSGTNLSTDSLTYSSNGRVITGYSAATTETAYLNVRHQPDSVRTVFNLVGGGTQTYWRRYRYTSQALLDSTWAEHAGGAFSFLTRRYSYTPALGTLDSMRLGANWTRFRYNPDRQATITRFPGTDSILRTFSVIHGLTRIEASGVMDDRYHLDSLGRVSQATDVLASRERAFTYDGLGRLTQTLFRANGTGCSWNEGSGWTCQPAATDSTHVFSYDAVGNRTSQGGVYSTGNRIGSFNGCAYGTDNDGNVTSRTFVAGPCPSYDFTFIWTADNRLDGFETSGASVRFAYDAFGRLVRRDVNGSARSYFLWDGDHLLAELDGTGAGKVAEYSWYGLDNPHAILRGFHAHHAHSDALGNVRALTNGTGLVTRTNTYDEWGRLIAATDSALGDSARARWKGALWMGPEVELYYMRNRWYEPWTGRFLSEDPIGLAGGINQYLFAAADPIGGLDPFGLQFPVKPIEATASCNTPPRSTEGKCAPGGAGPVIFQDPDQCLHGAICVSGTPGVIGPSEVPDLSEPEGGLDAECAALGAVAVFTVLTDAATLLVPASLLVRLGVTNLVAREAIALGAIRTEAGTNAIRVLEGLTRGFDAAAAAAPRQVASSEIAGSPVTVFGGTVGSLSWKDFVPVLASQRAISAARRACS